MSGTPVRTNAGPWKTSFASLARDWNAKNEEEKCRIEYEMEQERQKLKHEQMKRNSIFVYKHTHQSSDSNDIIAETFDTESKEDDEWKVVERKPRVELTTEERYEKMQRQLEEEKQSELDATNCGNNEWDYRDRRTMN
jgi:hypothetical protein